MESIPFETQQTAAAFIRSRVDLVCVYEPESELSLIFSQSALD